MTGKLTDWIDGALFVADDVVSVDEVAGEAVSSVNDVEISSVGSADKATSSATTAEWADVSPIQTQKCGPMEKQPTAEINSIL